MYTRYPIVARAHPLGRVRAHKSITLLKLVARDDRVSCIQEQRPVKFLAFNAHQFVYEVSRMSIFEFTKSHNMRHRSFFKFFIQLAL